MRVSVPSNPQAILSASGSQKISTQEAIYRLTQFLSPGNVVLLTGAGVSVDSGIRAYRGDDGRYMNPNYKPIFYHELVEDTAKGHAFRQRYWLRSFLGYPPVRNALPNTTHFALAALQHSLHIPRIITQNVDGLHHKALRTHEMSGWGPSKIQQAILELHGSLFRVRCKHGHSVDRDSFQEWLAEANPKWQRYAQELEQSGTKPRTNPDGDVAIEHLGISTNDFVVPDCPACLLQNVKNAVHKPEVTFFGESIPVIVKERSFSDIENSNRVLIMGTTLATYSAFRLLKHAIELAKPVMLMNVGPTRADGISGVEKIEISSGSVMRDVARSVIGTNGMEDPVIKDMLNSGVVKPPTDDTNEVTRESG